MPGYQVEASIDDELDEATLTFKTPDGSATIATVLIEKGKLLTVFRSLSEIARQVTPPGTPGIWKSRTVFYEQELQGKTEFNPI